jgi:hypothetical protein
MTLEEKVGQINMPCVYEGALGRGTAEKLKNCEKFAAGELERGIGPGGGFFTLANTILPNGARQQAEYFNELQQIALKTRLGIPLLQSEEGTHGAMCSGATIFPEGMALSSSWDMDLVKKIYTVAAREARSRGIHQLFTLVVEPNRDPRLGRNQEGFGEDPYLCARIAETIVQRCRGKTFLREIKWWRAYVITPARADRRAAWSVGRWRFPKDNCERFFCLRGSQVSATTARSASWQPILPLTGSPSMLRSGSWTGSCVGS